MMLFVQIMLRIMWDRYVAMTYFASEEIKVQVHIWSDSPKVTPLHSASHVKGVFTLENSFNHPPNTNTAFITTKSKWNFISSAYC